MNIDLFDEKTQARFRDLAAQVQEARGNGTNHGTVLSDAVLALKRLNKRAAVPEGMERIEIVQQRGPTLEFTGILIASSDFETRGRDPMRVEFEIYETVGGALVAVSASEPTDREGIELVNATVVERQDDALAMRCAVMAHFDWHDRARNMAKKLGWSLRMEVA